MRVPLLVDEITAGTKQQRAHIGPSVNDLVCMTPLWGHRIKSGIWLQLPPGGCPVERGKYILDFMRPVK